MKNMQIVFSSELPQKPAIQVKAVTTEQEVSKSPESVTLKNNVTESTDTNVLLKGLLEQNQLLLQMLKEGKSGAVTKNQEIDFAKFSKEIANAIAESRQDATARLFGIRAIDVSDIDPDDILEPSAYFFSWSSKYAVYDDYRNGQEIKPPVGAVKFKTLTRNVDGSGSRGVPKYSNISIALVYSKKQAEWLRNHSLFGITFFENIGEVGNVNQVEAEQIAHAYNQVFNLTGYALRQRCVREGIAITSNDDVLLRRKLVDVISKRLIEEAKTIKMNNLKSALTENVPLIGA